MRNRWSVQRKRAAAVALVLGLSLCLGAVALGQTVMRDPAECSRLRNEVANLKVAITATKASIPIAEYEVSRAYWAYIGRKKTTASVKATYERRAQLTKDYLSYYNYLKGLPCKRFKGKCIGKAWALVTQWATYKSSLASQAAWRVEWVSAALKEDAARNAFKLEEALLIDLRSELARLEARLDVARTERDHACELIQI